MSLVHAELPASPDIVVEVPPIHPNLAECRQLMAELGLEHTSDTGTPYDCLLEHYGDEGSYIAHHGFKNGRVSDATSFNLTVRHAGIEVKTMVPEEPGNLAMFKPLAVALLALRGDE